MTTLKSLCASAALFASVISVPAVGMNMYARHQHFQHHMSKVVQKTRYKELPYTMSYTSFPGFRCFDNANLLHVVMSTDDVILEDMSYDSTRENRVEYHMVIDDSKEIQMSVNTRTNVITVSSTT
jgi:hypothetical protein